MKMTNQKFNRGLSIREEVEPTWGTARAYINESVFYAELNATLDYPWQARFHMTERSGDTPEEAVEELRKAVIGAGVEITP